MGGPYRKRKYHQGDTHLKKGWKTKRRTKDLDQIDEDLKEGKVEKLLNQEIDFDKSGLGQFYCVHCSKHFIDNRAFQDHIKGKPHKRRLHALKTDPYTVEESQRAAGFGSYVKPGKRKMETLLPEAVKRGESLADVKKRAKLSEDTEESAAKEGEEKDSTTLDKDGDVAM